MGCITLSHCKSSMTIETCTSWGMWLIPAKLQEFYGFLEPPQELQKYRNMMKIGYMVVSWNRATPSHHPFRKMGFSIVNHLFGVSPWLWKPPWLSVGLCVFSNSNRQKYANIIQIYQAERLNGSSAAFMASRNENHFWCHAPCGGACLKLRFSIKFPWLHFPFHKRPAERRFPINWTIRSAVNGKQIRNTGIVLELSSWVVCTNLNISWRQIPHFQPQKNIRSRWHVISPQLTPVLLRWKNPKWSTNDTSTRDHRIHLAEATGSHHSRNWRKFTVKLKTFWGSKPWIPVFSFFPAIHGSSASPKSSFSEQLLIPAWPNESYAEQCFHQHTSPLREDFSTWQPVTHQATQWVYCGYIVG